MLNISNNLSHGVGYKCDVSHRQDVTEHQSQGYLVVCDIAHMTKPFPLEHVRASIKRLMAENGDQAKPLAAEIKLGETAIRDIFLAKTKTVGMKKLHAIAEHYRVTVEEILEGVATTRREKAAETGGAISVKINVKTMARLLHSLGPSMPKGRLSAEASSALAQALTHGLARLSEIDATDPSEDAFSLVASEAASLYREALKP